MDRKLSTVVLAGVWVLAMAATAAGPGPVGPIAPGPFGPHGDAVQVEGVITAIDGAALTVTTLDGAVQVLVTDSTVIWIGEEIVTPDALAVDTTVVVCGSLDDAGVLVAERINVKYVGQ
ncbi:MAG: hypothetical protein IT364_18060 [Candidatus Hydrogenedentes bacterium]|nr:hypothetical protein [Candidatus Hydrogenedentota bacterium]